MKRYLVFFAVCFSIKAVFAVEPLPQLQPISTYTSSNNFVGKLYKQPIPNSDREILIVDLHGTYRDMGEEYGTLLSSSNNPNYDILISFYNNLASLPLEHSFFISNLYKYLLLPLGKKHIPEEEMEMIYGAAKTSGLSIDQLVLLDKTLFFTFLSHLSTAEITAALPAANSNAVPPSCSMLAAWGDYTTSGDLLLGRNFDWAKSAYPAFNSLNSPNMLLVTIYHPTDIKGTKIGNTVATLGYPGWFSTVTGMNDKQLFLDLNSGWYSSYGINMVYPNSPESYFDFLTNALFSANNYTDLANTIQNSSPDMGYIIIGADGASKQVFAAEMIAATYPGWKLLSPQTVWLRDNHSKTHYQEDINIKDQNILIVSNSFRLDDGREKVWNKKTIIPWPYVDIRHDPNDSFPMLRYTNLLNFAQNNKGKIDVALMEQIFAKSINGEGDNAGPTEYQYDPRGDKEISNTYYTLVVDFAQNIWHIRQTGITKEQGGEDWVDINLNQFFK